MLEALEHYVKRQKHRTAPKPGANILSSIIKDEAAAYF